LIIVTAKGDDIFALRNDPMIKKELACYRSSVPKTGCFIVDTSALNITTMSKDELMAMDFNIDSEAITSETFRSLVRRMEFGFDMDNTKKALSNAFSTGQLSEDEIAKILHGTWIDKSRLNEITDLIKV
jgi:hypothetical protein